MATNFRNIDVLSFNGILSGPTEYASEENTTDAATNRFKKMYEKDRAYLFLNLGEKHATQVKYLMMSGGTTRTVWDNRKDTYDKENIPSKINLRTELYTITLD